MKITHANTTVAAGGHEGPRNLRVSHARGIQQADIVRAEYGEQWARGNIRNTITFEVTRIHDSLQAASRFVLDHAGTLPATGLLVFAEVTPEGTTRRFIEDAVLANVECIRQTGTTTEWAYVYLGGEILNRDPRTGRVGFGSVLPP